MTLISAEAARDFLEIVASLAADNAYHSDEYRRGAGETARLFGAYLEALIDDPEADREVAA
jgi:hypothetical protein